MSPCRMYKFRDRIENASNLFEELADDLRHGNEPDWECVAELDYQLKLLSDMIEADCAELEWEEEKHEMESKEGDIFSYWLEKGKQIREERGSL